VLLLKNPLDVLLFEFQKSQARVEKRCADQCVPVEVKVDPARYRPNDTPLLLGDPARMRDELGWSAQIPMERTLDDLLEYWRTRTP